MWAGGDFSGTKVALIRGDAIVAYLRDDKPGIPFPGLWDLPGGGREGDEDPITCLLREVEEEFGLTIPAERVGHLTCHPGPPGRLDAYFCAGELTDEEIASIRFGDEGQRWEMVRIEDFLASSSTVPDLQARLRSYIERVRQA